MSGAWGTSELLAACCGPAVKLWNPVSAEKAQQAETKLNEGTTVHALDWSSNNKVLAVAGEKAQVSMYGNGQMIGQIPNMPTPSIDGITSVRFGSDSKRMVIGCKNKSLHVLDLRQQGSGAKSNVDHKAPVCSLAISPDDAVIASSSTGGQLLLHDFKTGSKLMALSSDATTKRSLTFCPADGQLLACAADDGSVCVWNVKTRLPVHELQKQHKGPATGVSFAPDSTSVLYTCGRDSKLALVDVRRQQEVAVQAQQPLASVCARFDGRLLAAGTMGGVVLLFDVRKLGQSLASYGFSEQAPVTEVRWQHAPKSRDKAKAAAAAAAAAATAGASAGAAPPAPLAPSSSALEFAHRNGGGMGGGSALRHQHGGDMANGGGRALPVRSATPHEVSQSSDVNAGSDQMRAVSPVHRMGGSPTEDTTSAAVSSLHTAATPSNNTSLSSGMSGMAPYMVTPGFGVTRGLPGDTVDATPTSRAGPGALRGGDYGQVPGSRAALANGTQRLNKGDPTAHSQQPPKPPIITATPPATASGTAAQAPVPRPPVTPSAAAGSVAATAPAAAARPPSRGETPLNFGPSAAAGRPVQPAASGPAASAAAARPAAGQQATAEPGPSLQQHQHQHLDVGGQLPSSLQAAAAGHAAGGVALREDMFKAYVDESIGAVRQDIRDLHLAMLRQFHQAQMDLMSLVEGIVARQDELAQQVEQLSSHMERLGGRQDLLAWL